MASVRDAIMDLIRQAENDALERAAEACDAEFFKLGEPVADDCARAVRALKHKDGA